MIGIFEHLTIRLCLSLSLLANLYASQGFSDEPVVIESRVPTNFFSGQDVELSFRLKASQPVDSKIYWHHTAEHRTLSRGESDLKLEKDKASKVEIELRMPTVKLGVIQRTRFVISIQQGDKDPIADPLLDKALWVFPDSPRSDCRSEWSDADIALLDRVGDTRDCLDKLDVPVRVIKTLSTRDVGEAKIVIIAERNKIGRQARVIDELVGNGVSVLWICPKDHGIDYSPFDESLENRPCAIRIDQGQEFIKRLDKRIDHGHWLKRKDSSVGIRLAADGRNTIIQTTKADANYSCLTTKFRDSPCQLIVCGFDFATTWDSSPVPRYLIVCLLDQLACGDQSAATKNTEQDQANED